MLKSQPLVTILFFIFWTGILFAQTSITGVIVDEKGEELFAVNIYLISDMTGGTASNTNGEFALDYTSIEDTLVISFLGYKTEYIPVQEIGKEAIIVVLRLANLNLDQVTIMATDPISEDFAVSKLEKLDIYFDPFAQGDALRAVSTSSYATTTDESANPSLRGSSADRSIVYFNGVPIYNPVRNSQINGIGNFSIFNTEMVDNQYIYPSNPPLTYGNTSAGVIAIESIKKLESDDLQVSTTLASAGVLASKKLGEKRFVQGFSNYQFSNAFTFINPKSTALLNQFGSWDAGLNFHADLGEWTYNGFEYFIDEFYDVNLNQFSYESEAIATKSRFYTVQNISRLFKSGKLSIDLGYNSSSSNFEFGNLQTNRRNQEVYASVRYKHFFRNDVSLESGLAYDQQDIGFNDRIPTYFYALSADSPSFQQTVTSSLILPEAFVYLRKKLNKRWKTHLGFRSNFEYTSYQGGLTFKSGSASRVILSAGNYYSLTRSNFNRRDFQPLRSKQVALDYIYESGALKVQSALYYKQETGERSFDFFFPVDEVNTLGIELFVDWNFHPYWNFTFSNNYIDQEQLIYGGNYAGPFDFNYFIKSSFVFKHPKLPSFAVSYIGRPGGRYNEITSAEFDPATSFYVPGFSREIYGGTFNNYNRLDISFNHFLAFRDQSFVFFLNIANVLDRKNQQTPTYNSDYTQVRFTYLQERSLFFGIVCSKRKF